MTNNRNAYRTASQDAVHFLDRDAIVMHTSACGDYEFPVIGNRTLHGYGTITNTNTCLGGSLVSREEDIDLPIATKSDLGLDLSGESASCTTLAFGSRKRGKTFHIYKHFFFLTCLFGFGFAIVGFSRHQGLQTSSEAKLTGSLYIFNELFRGSFKRRPSTVSLERPPPRTRSLLLVAEAQVTPCNPIVNDIDRQLTAKGMQDAEGLGLYLKQHYIPEPDWIFTSPSERTAFTTELMRRHWASNKPVAFEDILYTLEFNDYFSFVTGLNDNFHRIMIVGHNTAILNTAKKVMKTHGIEDFPDAGLLEIRWADLNSWSMVQHNSGSAKMAIDPNNNFLYTSPR